MKLMLWHCNCGINSPGITTARNISRINTQVLQIVPSLFNHLKNVFLLLIAYSKFLTTERTFGKSSLTLKSAPYLLMAYSSAVSIIICFKIFWFSAVLNNVWLAIAWDNIKLIIEKYNTTGDQHFLGEGNNQWTIDSIIRLCLIGLNYVLPFEN